MPSELARLLCESGQENFLISAYDVANRDSDRCSWEKACEAIRRNGSILLLDSGNYESFWHRDQERWRQASFEKVLSSVECSLAFCYDDQFPPENLEGSVRDLVGGLEHSQSLAFSSTVCPIVHGPIGSLEDRVRLVAERMQPLLLAVAERELGAGLLQRAEMVRRLRRTIDAVAPYCALHILGTGNPIAIAIFSVMGAQSFDGLEWCQTCADPDSGLLYHFQHRELVRSLVSSRELPYVEATLLHNLAFYHGWMQHIRKSIADGEECLLLKRVIPQGRQQEFLEALAVS